MAIGPTFNEGLQSPYIVSHRTCIVSQKTTHKECPQTLPSPHGRFGGFTLMNGADFPEGTGCLGCLYRSTYVPGISSSVSSSMRTRFAC